MLVLYNLGLAVYALIIHIISHFNVKAKQWINGRKNQVYKKSVPGIWFHFASLGEFEQGRPVLEKMRILHPGKKLVITFFSPSGYEIRKNTPLADEVYYLPLDTAKNAREFIVAIQPEMAVFTKYEYWYHFFNELHQRNIPLYVISGIFRPNQVFFKWYGGLNRKILGFVTHFFVQDEQSKQLLQRIGIGNVTISGDTRFDRVWANARQPQDLPLIAAFINGYKVFIAGSTWQRDEQLVAALINEHPGWKFIIAPHEISEEKINALTGLLPANSVIRYSQFTTQSSQFTTQPSNTAIQHAEIASQQTLIIDNIGMLSSLYQYGDVAYIGGGFGAGIHNTLEAAAFGLPVIFGPNYEKFKEAKDLIRLKAGFSISNETALKQIARKLIDDASFHHTASQTITRYVQEHTGATAAIISHINPAFS